jgi:hypothetical protein
VEVVEVKVMVEKPRLAEFYTMYGKWMSGETAVSENSTLELLPWFDTQEDLALAQDIWGKINDRARGMLSILIDAADEKVPASTIGTSVDIPHGISGVAGVLAWPGRFSAAVGKKLPVQKEDGELGQGANYWMTKEVGALFAKARDAA